MIYMFKWCWRTRFVLSLYLANQLVQNVISNKALDEDITNYRLFSRWAKNKKIRIKIKFMKNTIKIVLLGIWFFSFGLFNCTKKFGK